MLDEIIFLDKTKTEITGDRVRLRNIRLEDLEECFKWLKDPGINKYLSQDFSELTIVEEIKWFRTMQDSDNDIVFSIIYIDQNELVGTCGLHNIDWKKKTCDFGISIGVQKYWNRGLGTDTLRCAIDYTRRHLKLNKINLKVYEYNKRAIKVYKNCGFRRAKILVGDHLYNKRYWDTYVMSLSLDLLD